MEPSEIGPYILLGLGSVAVVAVIIGHFKQLPVKSSILMWIFGVALLGIGSYGPAFLADYVGLVEALNQVAEAPGAEEMANFLDRADNAGVSPVARDAVLVDALRRNVVAEESSSDEVTAAVGEALDKMPRESENRFVLDQARARIEAESKVLDFARRHIEAASESRTDASAIEPGELEPFLKLGDEQLNELHIDRETVIRAQARAQEGG